MMHLQGRQYIITALIRVHVFPLSSSKRNKINFGCESHDISVIYFQIKHPFPVTSFGHTQQLHIVHCAYICIHQTSEQTNNRTNRMKGHQDSGPGGAQKMQQYRLIEMEWRQE